MTNEPCPKRTKIETRQVGRDLVTAWCSEDPDDPAWDGFLRQTVLGQFQQSGMWARAKQSEGWHPLRIVITRADRIIGGFQILWRSSGPIRVGYISKGPVVQQEDPDLIDFVVDVLVKIARRIRLTALIIQTPDSSELVAARLPGNLFLPNLLRKINDATLVVNLNGTFEDVQRRVQESRKTRQTIQQAIKRGVIVREGRREDIETLFQLMLSTCKRQGTKPNPGTVEPLYAYWDAAEASGCIKIFFAQCKGKVLAGLLCIPFGDTVVAWKKGWTSSDGDLHPNDLLMYEAIRWAHEHGYRLFDFAAVDRKMAVRLLNGLALSKKQTKSRHFFNLRFGAEPRLLPLSLIYVQNSVLRLFYRLFVPIGALGLG